MNSEVEAASRLADFFHSYQRILVITGAGCSTGSGITDYRDAQGAWKHAEPIMAQDFVRDESTRQRYWARSMRGWPSFANAVPNRAHTALAELEQSGMVGGLITQNVDGLHQQAGHRELIELHGSLRWVVCLGCSGRVSRDSVQTWLQRENAFVMQLPAAPAPDGDAQVAADLARVRVPTCERCGSVLKPNVVFFGESVPVERVQSCYQLVDSADAVVVMGSSLMVYSSFRFIRRARERQLPMVAVNQGKTRGDDWWSFKITEDCTAVLAALVDQLQSPA